MSLKSPLDLALYKTRKNVLEACIESGIEYDLNSQESQRHLNLDQCADCGIWLKPEELKPDLDGNGICPDCEQFYGL